MSGEIEIKNKKNNQKPEDGTVVLKDSVSIEANKPEVDRAELDDATQLAQGKRRIVPEINKLNKESQSADDHTRIRSRSVNLPISNDDDKTQIASDLSTSRADATGSITGSITGSTTGASLTDAIHRTNEEVKGLKSKNRKLKIINQRFMLASKLGAGGMGSVYRAKDLRKVEAQDKNPWVAVKLLNEAFKDHPSAFIALQREAQKSQKLAVLLRG